MKHRGRKRKYEVELEKGIREQPVQAKFVNKNIELGLPFPG